MKRYKVTVPNRHNLPQSFGVNEYDDHIKLSAYLSNNINSVDIPTQISEKPVTVVGADCFFNHGEITEISFPDTLTNIEAQAFAMCKGIKELILPGSIKEIESYAFRDCTGLKKIILPSSLKTLKQGTFAFTYLPDDVKITLNEGLETIQSKVFSGGGVNLGFTVKLPSTVKQLADDAFDPEIRVIRINYDKHIPLQHSVKAAQVIREAISESDLNDHIDTSIDLLRRIRQKHNLGLLNDHECEKLFYEEFCKGFFEYLKSKKLKAKICDNNWNLFVKDYNLWREGNTIPSNANESWLFYVDSEPARQTDKTCFFKLMESYSVPLAYFKPISDNCVFPSHHYDMYGTYMAGTVKFELIDDSGLYTCNNPIDKQFVLTDKTGLKAYIAVNRPAEKDEIHNLMATAFVGTGTIDGYTSSRAREIHISIKEQQTVWFWFSVGSDDLDVLHHFPLWDAYNAFETERQEKIHEHILNLMYRIDNESHE